MIRRTVLLVVTSVCLAGPSGTAAEEAVIVAFGDSTTAARGELVVYAQLLRKELPGRDVACRVVNAGLPAHTTEQARAKLAKEVLAHQPDLVVIQFGINDAAVDVWKKPPATGPRVEQARYEENLRFLIRSLTGRGVKVVLMTPNPLRWTDQVKARYGKPPYRPDDPDGLNVLLKQYAEGARKVAHEKQVVLVDVYAAFEAHGKQRGQAVDELLLDGIHPNERGHRLVADLLLPRIVDLFKENPGS